MFESVKSGVLDFLLQEYVKDKERWVSGKKIEDLDRFRHYKTSNVSRRCRELAMDGIVDRHLEHRGKTKFVMYRWKKLKPTLVFKTRKNKRTA